jgi:hypothetical protein
MTIGPQVALVDDKPSEVTQIKEILDDLNIGSLYFDANIETEKEKFDPIESIELVFLDLFYKVDFDPYLSAQWIDDIVPKNKKYNLILWTKDSDKEQDLIKVLGEIDRIPEYIESWQKTDFDPQSDGLKERIRDLIFGIQNQRVIKEETLFGEVVSIEDDGVIINCCLSKEKPVFQVRRFDLDLLSNVKDLKEGTFLKIHIYTKPGSRLIDVFSETNDHTDLFNVVDLFKGLEGSSFFKEG